MSFDINQGISEEDEPYAPYSALKVFHHKIKMKSFLEGIVSPPVAIRFKPTNRCDDDCFFCVYKTHFSGIHQTANRTDELSREKVMEVLRDLRDMNQGNRYFQYIHKLLNSLGLIKNKKPNLSVIYTGGGESLVHDYIKEALKKTLDYGLGLAIITNGKKLYGERAEILANADWVRISLEYADAETRGKIRRKDRQPDKVGFEQVAKNLEDFVKIKKPSCNLEANCVISKENYDKVYDIALFVKRLGLENIRFAPVWLTDFENYHKPIKEIVLEQIEKAKGLADKNFKVGSTYEKYFLTNANLTNRPNRCYWMQVVPVIAADGNVYVCHNKAYSEDGIIGSIKNQSFKKLWYSKETAEFFKKFNPKERCNKNECSSHERNELIKEFLACKDPKYNRYP